MGKMQILAYNSETKALRAIQTWGLNCFASQDLSALKFSDESDNWLLGCCPKLVNFKDILPFFVIILNTIIDKDKL